MKSEALLFQEPQHYLNETSIWNWIISLYLRKPRFSGTSLRDAAAGLAVLDEYGALLHSLNSAEIPVESIIYFWAL